MQGLHSMAAVLAEYGSKCEVDFGISEVDPYTRTSTSGEGNNVCIQDLDH